MIFMEIKVLDGVKIEQKANRLGIQGKLGSNAFTYNDALVNVKVEGDTIKVEPIDSKKLARKSSNLVNTIAKEITNNMKGVCEYYEKDMSMVFVHFPTTVEIKDDKVIIKNLFGERASRMARIMGGTKVEVKGQSIRVYGTSLEDVSQTAANIRGACKARHKDSRIFQDGIYYALKE
ncbi:50S ribosomal protein L6P [mine drainage metagenome]|uniref:50S ribosomal protein L6P n=1 Tax=mine drainage metagenome TaxID=410659 RepID=T1BCX9_9ZZZZ